MGFPSPVAQDKPASKSVKNNLTPRVASPALDPPNDTFCPESIVSRGYGPAGCNLQPNRTRGRIAQAFLPPPALRFWFHGWWRDLIGSDVDLLVEFEGMLDFDHYIDLKSLNA